MLNNLSSVMSNDKYVVTIVGDIMQHDRQLFTEQSRDFSYKDVIDSEIIQLFQESNHVIGNLETVITDTDFSGFPHFAAPEQLLTMLKDAGFTILTTANNHSLDKGEEAMLKSSASVVSHGMIQIGVGNTSVTCTNMTKRFPNVNVHTMTNISNVVPEQSTELAFEKTLWPKDGYNIAIIHGGKEYSTKATKEQIQISKKLVEWDFDAIIWIHSHVIGDEEAKVNKKNRKQFVKYGIGNFLSDQESLDRQLGQIIQLEFDIAGLVSVKKYTTETVFVDGFQKVQLVK